MILATRIFRAPCLVLICTSLSACLGSSTSGGGGDGDGGSSISPAAFEEAYRHTGGKGLTRDMPISGQANFAGATFMDLHQERSKIGELMADVEMSVDFAAASRAEAAAPGVISGRVHNIRGTIGAQDVAFRGQLTTADAETKGLPSSVRISTTTIEAPVIGDTTLRTGSLAAYFTGDLRLGDDEGDVILELGGDFTGPGAQGAVGTTSGTWFNPSNPEAFTASGRFYVDRK